MLQQDIVSAYNGVVSAALDFVKYVNVSDAQRLIALPQEEGIPTNERVSVDDALMDFWYSDGQDGRATRSYIGAIATDTNGIALADALNNAKLRFKDMSVQLQKDKEAWREVKSELNNMHSEIREAGRFTGLARLHLKQCWRQIPILTGAVDHVSFTWYSNGRSIQKITLLEAEKLLLALGHENPHIQKQLDMLAGLRPGECLARVQPQAPVIRANYVMVDSAIKGAFNSSMPMVCLQNNLPKIKMPVKAAPQIRGRAVRSDCKIAPEPFLPSIRAHLYI